jgi:predicted kinase
MNLKKLITESVINETIDITRDALIQLKKFIVEQMIVEGVDDPGILKCIFMAGGPGSGKSFTAMEIFGIDKTTKASFSSTGLKTINSDTNFEAGLKKNGINPRDLAKIEAENPELWDKIANNPGGIRDKAKQITKKQKAFYEEGRLGMIIDGTGDSFSKIKKQKQQAEELGYDTYMVFVNTSLEVAIERNNNRDRVLPEELVRTIWKDVQQNLGAFKGLFGGNFDIVDNTTYDKHDYKYTNPNSGKITTVQKPIEPQIRKATARFISQPIRNPIGKNWILTARALKKANFIK